MSPIVGSSVLEIDSEPADIKINQTNKNCCFQLVLCAIGILQLILLVVILFDQIDWSKNLTSGLIVAYSLIAAQQIMSPVSHT